MSRSKDGYWAPEDLNKAIEVHERGRQAGIVFPTEVGCQVVFDKRISRAAENKE